MYFIYRREEVVTYEAAGIGKKLGASASSRGLNDQEQAIYKRSLGDLCNQLIRASQTSLAATEERQKQRMASSFGKVICQSSKMRLFFLCNFQEKKNYQIESDSFLSMKLFMRSCCNSDNSYVLPFGAFPFSFFSLKSVKNFTFMLLISFFLIFFKLNLPL